MTSSTTRPTIVVVGPTAGGKTAISVELARALPGGGECVSADSMQVYRGMDIGTATPTDQDRGGIPHHLLDIVEPDQPWTLDDWLVAATTTIAEIRNRGHWPILVGGTNLYVQAYLFGLLDGPAPDHALRGELLAMDPADLRAELARRDPEAARRIHPNDRRRAVRALEYARLTGTPLTAAQVQWNQTCREEARILGLDWPTELINRRINARVKDMMAAGLLDEVRQLVASNRLGAQSAAAVGYAQLIEHLQGNCTLEEAVEQIKIRTRRLAKQQRTWLRKFRHLPRCLWVEPNGKSTQDIVSQAVTAFS
ncbi:MAG: tRNA (adenosine(37)-N6)-dimethylallyltransferase MiaA [Phycisphaerales bacterium]|jgi:tRNA dimethylallyltransferase|nr:tRNA (adenosine(37)-N6)-dimethylallyltransferase MiaA [Phycisphaerales bacterium]